MPTPLTGITTPTYGPDTWDDMADMAAALELLGLVAFPSEGARHPALPNPPDGSAPRSWRRWASARPPTWPGRPAA